MAESHLGSILGEEEDTPLSEATSAEADEAAVGAGAFAAAVAAIASRQDPQVALDTSHYLKSQARVLEIQAGHLVEEHQLRIQHLRNQLKEESVRHLGSRLKVAFQLFLALAATMLVIGAIVILHDAFTARDIVIEPFDTPAAMAEHGLSGKTIASSVLDELRRVNHATRANVERKALSQSWSEDIKLEIPEVGVSVGELARAVRARFGHDWHIAGDVVVLQDQRVALTVRGSEFDSKTFTGPVSDLPKLITSAAEYVYSEAEPVLWAYYLSSRDRDQEAVEFSKSAFASANKSVQPYLLNTWANAASNLGDIETGMELYRAAIRVKPDYWTAYYNLQLTQATGGQEEAAWRTGLEMQRAAGGRPGRASDEDFQISDWLTYNLPTLLASNRIDANRNGGVGTMSTNVGVNIAVIQIYMHDLAAASLTLQTVKPDPVDKTTSAILLVARGMLAAEQGRLSEALVNMESFWTAATPVVVGNWIGSICPVALVEEAAGRPEKTDEVFRKAVKSLDCMRFQGDVLDSRGRWEEAQKAYAQAVTYAPDLPAGYYSWGVSLLKHKDYAGAMDKLADAHKRGPHWADPLKALGDVYSAQRRIQDAIRAYDQALTLAPAWKELRAARGQVALLPNTMARTIP